MPAKISKEKGQLSTKLIHNIQQDNSFHQKTTKI